MSGGHGIHVKYFAGSVFFPWNPGPYHEAMPCFIYRAIPRQQVFMLGQCFQAQSWSIFRNIDDVLIAWLCYESINRKTSFNIANKYSRWAWKHCPHENLLPRIARYIKQGIASWYGPGFHGKKTATGEILTCMPWPPLIKRYQFLLYAQVTNLGNVR